MGVTSIAFSAAIIWRLPK